MRSANARPFNPRLCAITRVSPKARIRGPAESVLAATFRDCQQGPAEAALPQSLERGHIVDACRRERSCDIFGIHAFCLQFARDAPPAVSPRLLLCDRPRISFVRNVAQRGQFIESRGDVAARGAFGDQPRFEFGTRSTRAARAAGPLALAAMVQPRPAPRYSSAGAAPRAAVGPAIPTAARIFASMSAASSGCSFRYSRVLSLPWPILSP